MLLNQALYISAPAQRTAPANAADHCFVDIAGAVKKQTPQEHYTAYQLKLPVEIEKIIEISDPVYSYSEVMDHIDLNKYLTIEERRPGRPRYDQKTKHERRHSFTRREIRYSRGIRYRIS